MGQTAETYYGDENLYGGYQFVSLKDILDGLLMEAGSDDDHYLKNTNRSLLLRYAKDAIREVSANTYKDRMSFEITVPNNLTWPLPQDFIEDSSIKLHIVRNGKLHSLLLDKTEEISTSIGYLQDDDWNLLFDDQGDILTAEGNNNINTPYKIPEIPCGYSPFTDTSKLSKFGQYKIDRKRGIIIFSANIADKEVEINYFSNGLSAELSDSEITVDKVMRKTIEDYIYMVAIERKRTVSASEKQRAVGKYKASRHQARLVKANFSLVQIAKALTAPPIP